MEVHKAIMNLCCKFSFPDNESEARSHGDGEKQAMRISVKKRAKLILKKSKKQGIITS